MCSRGNKGAGRWARVGLPVLAVWILPVLWGCGSADDLMHVWTGFRGGVADTMDGADAGDLPGDPGRDSWTSDPGGTDPGVDPGTDPGTDPGADSGVDSGTDPGVDGGLDRGLDVGDETGTWFDSSSALTWENPPLGGAISWEDARDYCERLPLAGGGWRLPSISELRTLVRGCKATEWNGSCGVCDACLEWECRDSSCVGCPHGSGPAGGCYWLGALEGVCSWYWSSSPVAGGGDDGAFLIGFGSGLLGVGHTVRDDLVVRCVR